MIVPSDAEKGSFRIPASLNRPFPLSGSPRHKGPPIPGRAVTTLSGRSSTVPPRPVASQTVTPAPSSLGSCHYVLLKHAQTDAEAGEYWLAKKDGREPWPVVICDEEMIEKFFADKPRPKNARRADGTWRKEFRPRGDLTGQKCFPAMYLGTMRFCWVPWKRLQPLDIQMAVMKKEETSDKDLAKAYTEAIEQWDNHNIQYWKDKLTALRYMTEDEGKFVKATKPAKRKRTDRSDSPVFKIPVGINRFLTGDNVDDDEDLPFAPIKKEPKEDVISPQEMDSLYGNLDSKDLRRHAKAKKNGNGTPSRATSLFTPPTTPARSNVGGSISGLDEVRIYVGNPHHSFIVKKAGLAERSPLLANLVSHHRSDGSYIMSPLLSSMKKEDFKPLAEFLDRGEYRPNLLDDGTEWVRLENTDTDEERASELHRCGIIYCHAQQLELLELQRLVFRKVKALGSYPAFGLLSTMHLIYREGPPDDGDIHEFFVGYFAVHYYELLLAHPARFAEMMQGHPELSRCIFERMGRQCVVKEEAKEEEEMDETKSDDNISLLLTS